jgi:TetR/AcrR family transcriptional repressor of nem operon
MDAFWDKGFEATSMADLCTCTGLHKGSLYQAFGDKHKLFMDALRHYADSEFHETVGVMKASNTPLENLRAVVNKICDDMIARAQESGEISVKQSPYKLARQLMLTMAGGAAMVKGLVRPEEIAETMNDLVDSWV